MVNIYIKLIKLHFSGYYVRQNQYPWTFFNFSEIHVVMIFFNIPDEILTDQPNFGYSQFFFQTSLGVLEVGAGDETQIH